MPRILLKTHDAKKEYIFEKSYIFTDSYYKKIRKYELHIPLAAKIICKNENRIYSLVVEQPIIKVDEEGNIHIWTNNNLAEVELKHFTKLTKKEISYLQNEKKFLENKVLVGTLIEDNWVTQDIKAKLITDKLRRKRAPYRLGGGL